MKTKEYDLILEFPDSKNPFVKEFSYQNGQLLRDPLRLLQLEYEKERKETRR